LKPENIIVEEINNNINIKLIDFGAAIKIEKGKYLNKILGTVDYNR
jgi:serine/threonine protein kinase